MIDRGEVVFLRRQWNVLARNFDRRVAMHYRLKPQGWRERLFSHMVDVLSMLGLNCGYWPNSSWPSALKHTNCHEDGVVVLVWAIGSTRETIRLACQGFSRLAGKPMQFTPVLLTDVADFAFYTRLGWLVEYLPSWHGKVQNYNDQKLTYLAWRYRDAIVVPVAAGLANESEWSTFLELSST